MSHPSCFHQKDISTVEIEGKSVISPERSTAPKGEVFFQKVEEAIIVDLC